MNRFERKPSRKTMDKIFDIDAVQKVLKNSYSANLNDANEWVNNVSALIVPVFSL